MTEQSSEVAVREQSYAVHGLGACLPGCLWCRIESGRWPYDTLVGLHVRFTTLWGETEWSWSYAEDIRRVIEVCGPYLPSASAVRMSPALLHARTDGRERTSADQRPGDADTELTQAGRPGRKPMCHGKGNPGRG